MRESLQTSRLFGADPSNKSAVYSSAPRIVIEKHGLHQSHSPQMTLQALCFGQQLASASQTISKTEISCQPWAFSATS